MPDSVNNAVAVGPLAAVLRAPGPAAAPPALRHRSRPTAPHPATMAVAYAPAGVGNVAVGFDVLGHSLEAVGDRVTVRRRDRPGVEIRDILGCEGTLPLEPERNTATAGLLALARDLELPFGFEVTIDKGIPLGSGMGGSAASAVGALVAANALLPQPLDADGLLRYALVGEAAASGSAHADNLAPGIYGGLTLVRAMDPPDVLRVPVPDGLRCVLVHPHLRVDTRDARSLLPTGISRQTAVDHGANLAGFVFGCLTGDLELIRRSFVDLLAEPHRAHLVPGFRGVQRAALDAGALGCSLSGSGPSVFAWCADPAAALAARSAMLDAFAREGVPADAWISRVDAPGARLLEVV